jgi:exopolysaccharide biosynthesis polyprenyl glycosylphosphotransferase
MATRQQHRRRTRRAEDARIPFLTADLLALASPAVLVRPPGQSVALAAIAVAALAAQGAYRRRFSRGAADLVPRAVVAVAVAALVLGLLLGDDLRVGAVRAAALALPLLLGMRFSLDRLLTVVRRRHPDVQPVLIVGAGEIAQRLVRVLAEQPELRLQPVGFVDTVADTDLPLPVLGDVGDLRRIVVETGVRQVLIAFGIAGEHQLVQAVRACHDLDIEVWAVPRFFELGLTGPTADRDNLRGLSVQRLPRKALRTTEWQLKRVFDFTASSIALMLLGPVLLTIAVAVKLSSPGPVFFRQERIGQRGRTFELLKFRSLLVNDDQATTWNVTSDGRVTAIGRVLRRSSLDELPQLLNVLRGDMSLVGPRPERPHFVELFGQSVPGYHDRHRVPVGLSGLAQVSGLRGDTSIEDRAVYDNLYIEHWSLWNDVVILVRTFAAVVKPPASVVCQPSATIDLREPVLSVSETAPEVAQITPDVATMPTIA